MNSRWIRRFTLSCAACALFSLSAHLLFRVSGLGAHEEGRLFYTVILPLLFPLFLSIHWIAGRAGLPEAAVARGARLDSLGYLTVPGFILLGAGWEATGAFRLWAGILLLFLLVLKNGAVLRTLSSAASSGEEAGGKETAPGGFMLVGFCLAFLDAFAAASWIALPFWDPAREAGLRVLLLFSRLLSTSALFALLVSAGFLLVASCGFRPRAALTASLALGAGFFLCGALTGSGLPLFVAAAAVCAFSMAEMGDGGLRQRHARYALPILLYAFVLASGLSGSPPVLFFTLMAAGTLFLKVRDTRLVLPAVALSLFLFFFATGYRPFGFHQYGWHLFNLLPAFPAGLFTLCPFLLFCIVYALLSKKPAGRRFAAFFLIYILYLPMIRREVPGEMLLHEAVPALAVLGPPLAAALASEKTFLLGRAALLWTGALAMLALVFLPGIANPLFPPGVFSAAVDPGHLYVSGMEFWGFAALVSFIFLATGGLRASPGGSRGLLAPAFVSLLAILLLCFTAAWQPPVESTTIRPKDGAGDLSATNPTLLVAVPKSSAGCTRVTLISTLSRAASLSQGRVAGTIEVEGPGVAVQFPVRAGIETAEWSIDRPPLSLAAFRARPRHGRAEIESSFASFSPEGFPFYGHTYRADFSLPAPLAEGEVRIRLEKPDIGWEVDAILFSR